MQSHPQEIFIGFSFLFETPNLPWVVIGDFNIIKSNGEKIGGPASFAKADFVDLLDRNYPYYLPFLGYKFTWSYHREGIYTWQQP